MKRFFMFMLMLLTVSTAFAQEALALPVLEIDLSVGGAISFFGAAVVGAIATLFADAAKHFNSPDWSWNYFWKSKARPLLYTMLLSVVLYFLFGFLPFTKDLIAAWTGEEIGAVTATALFGFAAALIDGFTKKKSESQPSLN